MTEDPSRDGREPFAKKAAKLSVFLPLMLFAIGLLARSFVPDPKSRELAIVIGVVDLVVVFVALVLAFVSLAAIPKYGRKGILGYACGGIVLNSLIIAGSIVAFFAVKRVGQVFCAGYSKDEMTVMPCVIPDSRVIMNEEIGFRIEIPGGFVDNPHSQPANVLYAFLWVLPDASTMAINIDRLGGRIGKQPLTPEASDVIRRQLPPGGTVEHAVMRWDKHDVDVFISHFSVNDLQVCSHSVQIPLSREAIQVNIAGVEESIGQCQSLLQQVLAGLKGKSNWLN